MADMQENGHSKIKAAARAALFDGQYFRYVFALLLLGVVLMPLFLLIIAIGWFGIATSGIMPFLRPGGYPEIGILTDAATMVPLLGTVLLASLVLTYGIGFLLWGRSAMAVATMRRGLTLGHSLSGWGHGWKMGWIVLTKQTRLFLWTLLFFVPGIVKAFSYAMVEYVAVDHPDWSAGQCIKESCRLMRGNRLRYFILHLSLIGWYLVGMILEFMRGIFSFGRCFLVPYLDTVKASFYENLLDGLDEEPATEVGDPPEGPEVWGAWKG